MQKAIVLHSDILGFKKLIESAETDSNEETLTKLKDALTESTNSIKQFSKINPHTKSRLNFKLFSDNLYVSFSYEEGNLTSFSDAFILSIIFSRIYFENMLNNKIAVRGGISFGNDYSDESIIFSYALVKAYELECSKALYPRILIDNNLIDIVKQNIEISTTLILDILNNSIIYDEHSLYFINPSGIAKDFNSEYMGMKGETLDRFYIEQNINFSNSAIKKLDNRNQKEEDIIKKYEWLKDILLWNLNDRKKKSQVNKFSALLFV